MGSFVCWGVGLVVCWFSVRWVYFCLCVWCWCAGVLTFGRCFLVYRGLSIGLSVYGCRVGVLWVIDLRGLLVYCFLCLG